MARRKSCDDKPVVRRQSSNTGENVVTPMQRRRKVSNDRRPLMHKSPVSNINVTAEKGSSVSFLNLSSNNINGDFSNKHTASSQKKLKGIQQCVQQRIQYKIRRSSTRSRSKISDPHAQTEFKPKNPRRVLKAEFDASSENKENYVTVEKAKKAFEHQKVTLKGQIVDHTGHSPLNHQYKLTDDTGAIVLFSTDKKLELGWYSLTGVVVQSQKVLIVTPDTVITRIAPLEQTSPPCKKVVSGSIITAKVSVKYFCLRTECKTELPSPLNNEEHVTCQKCSHSVLYSEMPRFATAEITLKTDKKTESVFVLLHTHLCYLVPLGETGVIDTKDTVGQLLKRSIYLSVEGKEVIDVSDTPL